MSASSHPTSAPYYFVPEPSKWPAVGSVALALFGLSMAGWVNGAAWGPYLFAAFGAVLHLHAVRLVRPGSRESESGLYNQRVDASFRWSMSWFIFSEVMFFAAFFGALYYARVVAMPWLGDLDHKQFLWPDFGAAWPNRRPGRHHRRRSRPSVPGRCRRSTPRCCSVPA